MSTTSWKLSTQILIKEIRWLLFNKKWQHLLKEDDPTFRHSDSNFLIKQQHKYLRVYSFFLYFKYTTELEMGRKGVPIPFLLTLSFPFPDSSSSNAQILTHHSPNGGSWRLQREIITQKSAFTWRLTSGSTLPHRSSQACVCPKRRQYMLQWLSFTKLQRVWFGKVLPVSKPLASLAKDSCYFSIPIHTRLS